MPMIAQPIEIATKQETRAEEELAKAMLASAQPQNWAKKKGKREVE